MVDIVVKIACRVIDSLLIEFTSTLVSDGIGGHSLLTTLSARPLSTMTKGRS